jgi:predicted RecA/RadA family phage recombinase
MAKKIPLVLTNGMVERLQPGDRLDLSNSTTKTNASGGTINIGTPVYVNGVNAAPAQADAQSTMRVAGLADTTTNNGSNFEVMADGVFTATTTEWDAVTGETGGLTPGADYFLSEVTAGQLTQTAPDNQGDFVVRVGLALSATELEVEVAQPIKL